MSNWVVVSIDKSDYIAHHGIMGQKWGKKNGPPYPLDEAVSTGKRLKTKEEKKASKEFNKKVKAKSKEINRRLDDDEKLSKEWNEEISSKNFKKKISTGAVIGVAVGGIPGAVIGAGVSYHNQKKKFLDKKALEEIDSETKKTGEKIAKHIIEHERRMREIREEKISDFEPSYDDIFYQNLKKIRSDSKTKAAFRNYVKENYPNRNLSEIDDDRLDAMMDDYAEYLTDRQYYKK